MKKIAICDGNNFGARHYMRLKNGGQLLTNNLGDPTTITFGVLRTLNMFVSNMDIDRCIIVWDGKSYYRKKIFKHYKGNRDYSDDDFEYYIKELENARYYYDKLGVSQIRCNHLEADDVIGYLVAQFRKKKYKTIVMSDDRDFFQLCKYKPLFYRPSKGETLCRSDVEEKLGFPPSILLKIRALTGDKKDNIPGACDMDENNLVQKIGLGDKTALKLLTNEDGTYKKLSELFKTVPKDNRFYEHIVNKKKQIMLSYKLCRIRTKEKYYMKAELKELRKAFDNVSVPKTVSRSMVKNVQEYLEFGSINLIKILKRLGVKVK